MKDINILNFDLGSRELLPPGGQPGDYRDKPYDPNRRRCVIHVLLVHWIDGRKVECYRGEEEENKSDDIQDNAVLP